MTIDEIQNKIIEEFSIFEDWMDKYNYLIELGRDCPIINEKDKTEANLINGCQSRVWVNAELIDGKMDIKADSDAVITKGIITLLLRIFNNQTPKDVYESEVFFIEKIGLSTHLSPTRSNGLLAMVKQIKLYALAFMSVNK
ncbi:MAG: SufE family protein [Bacteroidales bacterium]|nr:SufE family protein [Bacteroidales bacterium]